MFYRFDLLQIDVLPIHVVLTFAISAFCDKIKLFSKNLITFEDFTQLHRYFHQTRLVLHYTTPQIRITR